MTQPPPKQNKLYAQVCLILMKSGVIIDEIDACLRWAFGLEALFVSPADWPARWNKLHPKAFHAKKDEKFVEFVYVVGFLYAAQKKQEIIAR